MNDPSKPMPRLHDVLEELRQLEPIFHRPEPGAGPADGSRITEPGFWEIGASGQRYSRDHVLEVLATRAAHPARESLAADDFSCHPLAPGLYLLSYRLRQDERVTRRTTLWRRTVEGWKAVYHQGTPVASP
ncbi:DUF4440 domain-containing protein [Dyella sp.]|jgi:hypothetical protein|uniref:nuclear transport factor 2 family protein n=1 Tax=Dyella sp. TaxID=1869338 RepID=UPI002D7A20E4|nr:DUF4440 domain-containing protein [Dyella sp.]HET6433028.1 DUF4440 domain-containing protein [Dyella sp.]